MGQRQGQGTESRKKNTIQNKYSNKYSDTVPLPNNSNSAPDRRAAATYPFISRLATRHDGPHRDDNVCAHPTTPTWQASADVGDDALRTRSVQR